MCLMGRVLGSLLSLNWISQGLLPWREICFTFSNSKVLSALPLNSLSEPLSFHGKSNPSHRIYDKRSLSQIAHTVIALFWNSLSALQVHIYPTGSSWQPFYTFSILFLQYISSSEHPVGPVLWNQTSQPSGCFSDILMYQSYKRNKSFSYAERTLLWHLLNSWHSWVSDCKKFSNPLLMSSASYKSDFG